MLSCVVYHAMKTIQCTVLFSAVCYGDVVVYSLQQLATSTRYDNSLL